MPDSQLIVFAGLPGTGKTSLARAVARQKRAVYLDKDTIKERTIVLATEMHLSEALDLAGPLSYTLMVDLARDNLTLGLSVVLDSPAAYAVFQDRVKQLARSLKIDLRWVECVCSDEQLLRQRFESRGRDLPGYHVRDWTTYERDRTRFEGLAERRLVVDTAEPLALNLRKLLAYLDQPLPGSGS